MAEFVDVVESGSFAAAALRLGVTRSAVAKVVARLPPRRAAPAAHDPPARPDRRGGLRQQCRRLLAELGETEAALDGQREPAGRLRVSVPVLFGRQCVAPVMRRLVERHPRLEIDVPFSDRVADLANDGFDIAVRIGELADTSALVGRKLGVQRMGICASPRVSRPSWPAGGLDALRVARRHRVLRAGNRTPWRALGADGAVHDHRPAGRLRLGTTCRRSPMRRRRPRVAAAG